MAFVDILALGPAEMALTLAVLGLPVLVIAAFLTLYLRARRQVAA